MIKNNALYTTSATSKTPCDTSGTYTGVYPTSDYNRFYCPNNSDLSWNWQGVNKTLAQWRTLSSQDANSTYGTLTLASIPANGSTSSSGDYTPTTGSALIDAGVTISGFSMDYNGASRPIGAAWDIGAFESSASGSGGGGGGATYTLRPGLSGRKRGR